MVTAGILVCALVASGAQAQVVDVIGGQTNVLLDTALLSSAANLDLSSVSGEVIVPGNLGPNSVAFPINPRNAMPPALATTFSYDPTDFLNTFSGTIEHDGSVRFNSDTIDVGDFTIGFDAARAGQLGGLASGFFVQDNVSLGAILFDVENPTTLTPTPTDLTIAANLLVSPEFGQFLLDNGFSSTNLQGADVGDALVEAIAPEPASIALLGLALLITRRR
jgi:hypothetical protein